LHLLVAMVPSSTEQGSNSQILPLSRRLAQPLHLPAALLQAKNHRESRDSMASHRRHSRCGCLLQPLGFLWSVLLACYPYGCHSEYFQAMVNLPTYCSWLLWLALHPTGRRG
jgi:hypothetical protein